MPHSTIRKLILRDFFNCGDLSKFKESIVAVLPYTGISGSNFFRCRMSDQYFLTKMSFYYLEPKELYGTTSKKVMSQTDAEISILQLLKEKIIDSNVSPCILEIIYAKKCKGISKMALSASKCDKLITSTFNNTANCEIWIDKILCSYNERVKSKEAHDKCAFLILEKCDITLAEYVKNSINTPVSVAVFKSILFQIIYTLYAIKKIYPSFWHADLHTGNIMLLFDPHYKFKLTNPKFIQFTIDGEINNVPYFGIFAKIIDFGFSSIPEVGIVSNIIENKGIMFHRLPNDIIFLFHHLYTNIDISLEKKNKINKILSALDPAESYIHFYTPYLRKIEARIPTYAEMLQNQIFDEYREYDIPLDEQIYRKYTPV